MVKVKMMNENVFAKLTKEFSALGELIRTRQEEKQSVLNEFDRELSRYKKGNISENTLASSVKKTNVELMKLDKSIRDTIVKFNNYSKKISELVRAQKPLAYRARETGSGLPSTSVKKTTKKKAPAKKRVVAKKKTPMKKMSKAEIAKEVKAEKKLR